MQNDRRMTRQASARRVQNDKQEDEEVDDEDENQQEDEEIVDEDENEQGQQKIVQEDEEVENKEETEVREDIEELVEAEDTEDEEEQEGTEKEIEAERLNDNSTRPKRRVMIESMLLNGDRGQATVLAQQPKRTTVWKNWVNVRAVAEDEDSSVNWDQVRWWREKESEQVLILNDYQEADPTYPSKREGNGKFRKQQCI